MMHIYFHYQSFLLGIFFTLAGALSLIYARVIAQSFIKANSTLPVVSKVIDKWSPLSAAGYLRLNIWRTRLFSVVMILIGLVSFFATFFMQLG
jgi:hypothetical protein